MQKFSAGYGEQVITPPLGTAMTGFGYKMDRRVTAVLDDLKQRSTVWSWVRSSAYFQSLPVSVATRPIVPISPSKFDCIMTSRDLAGILGRA